MHGYSRQISLTGMPMYLRKKLYSTCFANPVDITIELPFELLLPPKFEKGLAILNAFSLFGEFSGWKKKQKERVNKASNDGAFSTCLLPQNSKQACKKEPCAKTSKRKPSMSDAAFPTTSDNR